MTAADRIIELVKPHVPIEVLRELFVLLDQADTESKRDILNYMHRAGGEP